MHILGRVPTQASRALGSTSSPRFLSSAAASRTGSARLAISNSSSITSLTALAASSRAPAHARTMILRAQTAAGGKGPLMASQDSLLSLPVPPLEQTLQKYLRTTVPHQTPESLKKTEQAVQSALNGEDAALFKQLQARLEQRAKDPESDGNWLASWWNDAAYMGYRAPVVPFVSYFYMHKDDRRARTAATRAATQLKAVLQFRKLVESEQLSPEKTKAGPMCSGSYPWMFNSSRLPASPLDQAKKYDTNTHTHIVVAHNGRFYEMDVYPDGQELSAAELEAQFEKIRASGTGPAPFPIGALTSQDRDKWLKGREALLQVSGAGGAAKNEVALERIQSSIILVCLDELAPVTTEERAWELWWGDGKNRFYDKQQLIYSANGKAGYMGEHAPMDGTPTLRMNDFVLSALDAGKIDLGATTVRSNLAEPKELSFALDSKVEGLVKEAIHDFESLKSEHDCAVLDFSAYGKGDIKKFKCSPDAWVQMVIQLAYFRLFGKPCPTYESAQTRKFKWGRTETIRSASVESLEFVKAMESNDASDAERSDKFQKAVKQHLTYAKEAADGQGVDRHLFGLKNILREGEQPPALYRDEAYSKTSNWQLSTSQISSESFDAWGYGEVTPDGFGCAYAIKEDSLTFTLTSRNIGSPKLRHYINEAAIDLRNLHRRLAAAGGSEGKAKM